MKKRIPPDRPVTVLAADFSLRSPALAVLSYDPATRHIWLKQMVNLDNRVYGSPYGFLLKRIYKTLCDLCEGADVFIREGLYMAGTHSARTLAAVEGVANLALWQVRQAVFIDIPPSKVKQLVAGSGDATKERVAASLSRFVGDQRYTCTDHSDAVAVGIAWLIQSGRIDAQYSRADLGLSDGCPRVTPVSIPCERNAVAYARAQFPEESFYPAGRRPVAAPPCLRPVVD